MQGKIPDEKHKDMPNPADPAQPPVQPAAPNMGGPAQPPAQVAVPDVVGLTRSAAQDKLKSAGLVVGAVKTHDSNSVPAGGGSDTNPDAGTLIHFGSAGRLDISNGP